MAEVIGHLTLLNKALPTGVDGTRLAEWELRDGVTYGELANQVALALAQANQELANRWGWCFGFTEDLMQEYENGGAVTAMEEMTDMDRPKPVLGTTIGHMIDLRSYGSAIGGTRHYFRDARSALINTAIRTNVRKAVWRFEQKLLTRWLTNTENAIGAAGYDVPFVRGTGGNVDFAPPAFEGEAFTTSHDHYVAIEDELTRADLLNTLAETLQEHGHEPPFRAVVARADVANYAALTKFIEMVSVSGLIIDRGGESSGNQMFRMSPQWIGGHFGDFQSDYGLVELFATARIPTLYAGMTKSYGQLDARNGLAVRVHPSVGFGMMIVPETTINDDTPIKQLDIEFEFGMGVGADRTNGAAGYIVNGASWSNPTIS
jgi:hypothetical protein